jgi:mono/diheme cytochrome c family protein
LFDIPGRYDFDKPILFERKKGLPIYNTFLRPGAPKGEAWRKLNTGGCVGCHGAQGQQVGGDFSVILARGRVTPPESPDDEGKNSNRLLEKNEIRDKK